MSYTKDKPPFPPLKDGERYSSWSFFVETWLMGGDGLWDIVSGEEPEPHPSTVDPSTGKLVAPTLTDDDKKSQKEWIQRDAKARAKILILLDEGLFPKFCPHRRAKELWDAIREAYEEGSTQNVLLWWMELTQTRLEESEPLQPHLDRLLEASRKLASADFIVPEALLVMVILVSLPTTFHTVVTSLHTSITASSPSTCVGTDTLRCRREVGFLHPKG